MDEAASSTTSLSTPQTLAVYEVETRGYKNTSFHVSKQLPHFQLQSGNPSLSLEEVNCPDGYKFISNWKIDYVAPNVEGVERSTDRYFDKHGWEYSTAWEKLISPMRMPRGTLKITDKVRRRRWIRRMVKIDPMEARKHRMMRGEGVLSKVQQGLRSLEKSLREIERFIKMIGTSKDSIQARKSISSYILMSTKVLGKTADLVGVLEDEGQRMKVGREVDRMEARLVKLVEKGEEMCLTHPLASVKGRDRDISSVNDSKMNEKVDFADIDDVNVRNNYSFQKQFQEKIVSNNKANEPALSFEEQQIQKKLIGSNEAALMGKMIEEKGEAIKEVNKSMAELAVVFKEVATLVSGQQEFIDEIEGNAEITRERTKQGLKDLEDAVELQRKSTCVIS